MSHAVELMGRGSENLEERVIRELRREIGGAVPDEVVVDAARRALDEYRDARIQQFVPILATRDALADLREHRRS